MNPKSEHHCCKYLTHIVILAITLILQIQASVVYPSREYIHASLAARSPYIPIYNATLQIVIDHDCSDSLPNPTSNHEVVLFYKGVPCYMHIMAQQLYDKGFVGGIIRFNPETFFELTAVNYWNQETENVPIYRALKGDRNWTAVSYIDLDDDQGEVYFETSSFIVQSILVSMILIIASSFKLYVAIKRLRILWEDEIHIDVGISVLVIEGAASILSIIWSLDPLGGLGVFSYGFMYFLMRVCLVFSFSTTCILWVAFMSSSSTWRKSLLSKTSLVMIGLLLIINIISSVYFVILYCTSGAVENTYLGYDIMMTVVTHCGAGVFFVRYKKVAIQTVKSGMEKNQDEERRKRYRNVQYHLRLSALFMFLFATTMSAMAVITLGYGTGLLFWYLLCISHLFTTIIGIFQVLSVSASSARSRRATGA